MTPDQLNTLFVVLTVLTLTVIFRGAVALIVYGSFAAILGLLYLAALTVVWALGAGDAAWKAVKSAWGRK